MSRIWSKQQEDVFTWFATGKGNLLVRARAGTGKCLGKGTPVLMYDGSIKPVEDVKVGEYLMGPDSAARLVLQTNTGRGSLRRIVPTKGDAWVCNDVHVMTLVGTNHNMGETIDVPLNELPQGWERKWKLWRTGADWAYREPPVDPYLVGLWIGDGTCGEAQITNSDPEVMEFCNRIAATYGTECVTRREEKHNTFNLRFRVGTRGQAGRHTPNILQRFFASCSVDGKKRPPDVYRINDRHVRKQVLSGILDTDGFYGDGGFEVATVDPWLRDLYLFLARSLGFAAYASEKTVRIKELGFTGIYWRVYISGDFSEMPCRVHKPVPRKQIKRVNVTGFEIEDIGEGEYFGFTLDGDGRFLLGDFTVTHNTTTIIEATARAPEQFQLVAAFNRRIAQELERKIRDVNGKAEAKTLHGIGYAVVGRYWERAQLDARRGYDLAKRAAGDQAPDEMIKKVQKLASIAKGCLATTVRDIPQRRTFEHEHVLEEIAALHVGLIDELEALAIRFDLEPGDEWEKDGWTTRKLCSTAAQAMELARHRPEGDQTPTLDYDDMIYLPVANNWARPRYELVVIDEAQDMNATQLALAMSVVTPEGRVAVVGDDRQAIYGFRGADSGALDRLKKELNATELGLTTTYRCGRSIVSLARKLVPDFEAGPENPQGEVISVTPKEMLAAVRPGDFILSRKNAPLATYCLKLIRAGVAARIEGKDVAAGLKAIVRRWKPRSLQGLVDNIEKWRDREIEKLTPKAGRPEADERMAQIRDQAEILLALCDGLANPAELVTRLDTMFCDSEDGPRPMVVCSSIHRSKGLEADRVFILKNTLYPQAAVFIGRDKMAPAEADARARSIIEEANLEYVAQTRARNVLAWVTE